MKNFKQKWGINSNFQLIIILVVFSITGSLTLLVSGPLIDTIGIKKELLPQWIFWLARILIIFPTYQILILIVGTVFGQFKFFWNFEKKMLSRLGFKHFKENE